MENNADVTSLSDKNDAILRGLFSRKSAYRKGKLANRSPHYVIKFLTTHCEKVNSNDRNSEWRLKPVGHANNINADPLPTSSATALSSNALSDTSAANFNLRGKLEKVVNTSILRQNKRKFDNFSVKSGLKSDNSNGDSSDRTGRIHTSRRSFQLSSSPSYCVAYNFYLFFYFYTSGSNLREKVDV